MSGLPQAGDYRPVLRVLLFVEQGDCPIDIAVVIGELQQPGVEFKWRYLWRYGRKSRRPDMIGRMLVMIARADPAGIAQALDVAATVLDVM